MPNPMPISAAEVKELVEKHNLTRLGMGSCSICGYPLAFIFEGGEVSFDAGCDCITRQPRLEPRSYQDVANHYNLQERPEYIAELNLMLGRGQE